MLSAVRYSGMGGFLTETVIVRCHALVHVDVQVLDVQRNRRNAVLVQNFLLLFVRLILHLGLIRLMAGFRRFLCLLCRRTVPACATGNCPDNPSLLHLLEQFLQNTVLLILHFHRCPHFPQLYAALPFSCFSAHDSSL